MKNKHFAIWLIFAFVSLSSVLACDMAQMINRVPVASAYGAPTYSQGDTNGTMDYHEDVFYKSVESKLDCSDPGAKYHLLISSAVPGDSKLSVGVPGNQEYFRLDAFAAWYLADKGECDYSVSRSDALTDFIMEGSYDPVSHQFTIMSCGSGNTVGDGSNITHIDETTVAGNILCRQSPTSYFEYTFDQMRLTDGTVITPARP